jgi:hypothetical protein
MTMQVVLGLLLLKWRWLLMIRHLIAWLCREDASCRKELLKQIVQCVLFSLALSPGVFIRRSRPHIQLADQF